MTRLVLLADSNFLNNIEAYRGPRLMDLEVKPCQSKRALLAEVSAVEDGIMVVSCLDLMASEAAKSSVDFQDRAVELHLNHILMKIMEQIENSDNKVACGIVAPIFWTTHSKETKNGLHHTYKLFKKSPVQNLWTTDYVNDLMTGSDGVHLIPHAANKYISIINGLFVDINRRMKFPDLRMTTGDAGLESGTAWSEEMESNGTGFILAPPDDDNSTPTRTLSMVSTSMLDGHGVVRISTQERLVAMAMPDSNQNRSIRPRPDFTQPPPVIHPPMTQPTMLNYDWADAISRIEKRLGGLESKAFKDNLMMASLKEEQDTEANKAMLDRVTIIGLNVPNLFKMNEKEKIESMRKKAQEMFDFLAEEGQKFEAGFVRHLNRQRRGRAATIIEVRLATVKQAGDLRMNYIKSRNKPELEGVNVVPTVRLGTKVRIEIMQAAATLIKQHDKSVTKTQCLQYVPKPVLKVFRSDQRGVESNRSMSFIEVVIWVKENGFERTINLRKAYDRAGSSFRNNLPQSFVIME